MMIGLLLGVALPIVYDARFELTKSELHLDGTVYDGRAWNCRFLLRDLRRSYVSHHS